MSSKDLKTIKPQTPFLETVFIIVVGALGLIITLRFFIAFDFRAVWIFLFVTTWTCAVGMMLLTNKRYKKIELNRDSLSVTKFYPPIKSTYKVDSLRGYGLTEIYNGLENNKIITLMTNEGTEITFPKEGYKNYGQLLKLFHDSGIPFSGTKELKSKENLVYRVLLRWGFIILPLAMITLWMIARFAQ
jgi:hypothetical protein